MENEKLQELVFNSDCKYKVYLSVVEYLNEIADALFLDRNCVDTENLSITFKYRNNKVRIISKNITIIKINEEDNETLLDPPKLVFTIQVGLGRIYYFNNYENFEVAIVFIQSILIIYRNYREQPKPKNKSITQKFWEWLNSPSDMQEGW